MKRFWTPHLRRGLTHPDEDPARDAELAHHLMDYESLVGSEPSAAFRARLANATADAVALKRRRGWIVETSRYSRAVLALSCAAAAAAVILLLRMPTSVQPAAPDLLLAATVGATSSQDLARSWSTNSQSDRDLLEAFGMVTP